MESLQGVIARSHCKESWQGVMARSHCKESLQGVIALDSLHLQLALDSLHLQIALGSMHLAPCTWLLASARSQVQLTCEELKSLLRAAG